MKVSRFPYIKSPFKFKKRRTGFYLFYFGLLLILISLIQLSISFTKSENSHSAIEKDVLRKVLVKHGEEIQLAYSYDLDWFRRYLIRLRKAEARSKKNAVIKKKNRKLKGETKEKNFTMALNNMAMTFIKIGKNRYQPCLKLLPPPELEHVQFPPPSDSPIQNLTYYSMDEDDVEIMDSIMLLEGKKVGRTKDSEIFFGKQSLLDRSASFQVKNKTEVHCGFAKKGSGFEVSEEDASFMANCTVVVMTCTFGGGDDLYQPIGMTNASLKQVCFVAFWDNVTLLTQSSIGLVPNTEDRRIGHWRIITVSNLPFVDQRRNGKIPKMLSHRLFPNAQYSIWVDSKLQLRRDPLGILEALLWRKKAVFAISEHAGRSCVYSEGEAIVLKNKSSAEEVAVQLNHYWNDGLPLNAKFDGQQVLPEASVIIREHTTLTNLFMCLWFNEVVRFTSRDQLSFGYVLTKLNALHVSPFPACTRHALANVIGHRGKAHPLPKLHLF